MRFFVLVAFLPLAVLVAVLAGGFAPVAAQETPEITVTGVDRALLGERFEITVEVRTTEDVEVEIDPASPGWSGVEVVDVAAAEPRNSGGSLLHRLTVTAVSFQLGAVDVRPAVLLIENGLVNLDEAPPFALEITPSLPPGAPLELISQPQPQAVAGETRSWARPLLFGGAATVAILALCGLVLAVRRRPRRVPRPVYPGLRLEPSADVPLPGESETLADPVAAYRTMGATVRKVLADRYHLPALAMTTGELGRRMEAEGVDRWQARLVRGLLENCDAVVYAGYRPAPERRRADLTVAREIVEGNA